MPVVLKTVSHDQVCLAEKLRFGPSKQERTGEELLANWVNQHTANGQQFPNALFWNVYRPLLLGYTSKVTVKQQQTFCSVDITRPQQYFPVSCYYAQNRSMCGSGLTTPLILNFGTIQDEWSPSRTGRLSTGKTAPGAHKQDAGWAAEMVWTF